MKGSDKMNVHAFWAEMDSGIGKFDLLCHPFYLAWAAGELSREDHREYAAEYYHHVAAFPTYLADCAAQLPDGGLRQAIMANFSDEMGLDAPEGRPHHLIWLQFAEEMGASIPEVRTRQPIAEVRELVESFKQMASANPAAALSAFYAYESQVPRVAVEKERGLREHYGASDRACEYFRLHGNADIHHAGVWREQLTRLLEERPELAPQVLDAADTAAHALWHALDGIERTRLARRIS